MVMSAVKVSLQGNRERSCRLLRDGGFRGFSKEVTFELRLGHQMEIVLQRLLGSKQRGQQGKGLMKGRSMAIGGM